MSPASKRSPPSARGRARASIASERSMPSVSRAASSWWSRAVGSPVPDPRSTTGMPARGRTSASRSRNGRVRSSRKRSYCAGSQASSRVIQDQLPIRRPDRLQTPPAMRASDAANRPRWSGRAGFFEVWFLVVFEAAARRAWWLRYTTFAPAPGQPGEPRATLWAAAFDARGARQQRDHMQRLGERRWHPARARARARGPEAHLGHAPRGGALLALQPELRRGGGRLPRGDRGAPQAARRRALAGADLAPHRPPRARSVRARVARGQPGRRPRSRTPRVPLHLRDPLAPGRGLVRSAHARRLRLP